MTSANFDCLASHHKGGPIHVYCMSSLVAEEARRGGFAAFAADMEKALASLLAGMSETQQKTALMLACALTEAEERPDEERAAEAPRLRLVVSRR